MNDRLRKYIDNLFVDAPETRKTVELKEEILQNITDKYYDLLSEGKTEEAAYNIAIASVGEVSELIENLKRGTSKMAYPSPEETEKARKESAKITAISVAIFILSPITVILSGDSIIGVVLFLSLIAIATALLIYNNMTKPKYTKMDDTIVEEFKEWKENRDKKGLGAISSAIWSLTVALYFAISFYTGAWHITWIIFLISGAVTSIVKAMYDLKGVGK